jgi:lipid II:glycine glycyltransferase (peptidoglycan interpeptide bridge formation enzyme)
MYDEGGSEKLLRSFYHLVLRTRRRHQLPPQPLNWFRNLLACLGENAKIRLVYDANHPIAGIMTLQFRDIVVYKYGCSDPAYHRLGGMQFLLWRAIQEAKQDGAREFDLGRSDWDDTGLVAFKDRWGSARSPLLYLRYPPRACATAPPEWVSQAAKRAVTLLPDWLLAAAGNLVYKHFG